MGQLGASNFNFGGGVAPDVADVRCNTLDFGKLVKRRDDALVPPKFHSIR